MEEAKKSLQFLRDSETNIDQEIDRIKMELDESLNNGSVGIKKIISSKEYLKPIMIILILMILQQCSGILFIYSYLPIIFEVMMINILKIDLFPRVQAAP